MRRRREDDVDDVEISASVSADELVFHKDPVVRTRVRGWPEHESLSVRERDGLPWRVRSGQVYRNVHVDYRVAGAVRAPEFETDLDRGGDERGSEPPPNG